MTPIIVGVAVLFGAVTQRLTGMGFSLIAGPLLVLFVGAGNGVPLIQVLSFFVALSTLVTTFRDVQWLRAALMMLPALLGIVPAWYLVRAVSGPMLLIVIGGMVVVAILAMVLDERFRVFKGAKGLVGAGFLSGFMNYTAGVGGPAIVLYTLSNHWSHRHFVGSVQVYFMALNVMSLVGQGIPTLPNTIWISAAVALTVGILLGNLLAPRVPVTVMSKLVVAVALFGALATIVQGATQLIH